MRSPKTLAIGLLVTLGLAFAGANLSFAAARSTIPLGFSGTIVTKQRRAEKWLGVDDVYLLTLDSGRRVQVDATVFESLSERQSVSKQSWEHSLKADGQTIPLTWSADVRGMLGAMPLTVLVCVLVGVVLVRPSRPNP